MPGLSASTSDASDVVVVGGGIIGCSAAAFLAGAGAQVTLIEIGDVAAGASGRNSGVVQHPFDRALRDLHLETLAGYRELATEADLDFTIGPDPAGLLLVALAADGPRAVATALRDAWPELDPVVVEGADLRRLEPALAPEVAACYVPIGYPVPPAAATRAYAALARRRGARIVTRVGAVALVHGSRDGAVGRVTGVRLTDGRMLAAGSVLVAAGPWSPALLDPTGRWRPIRPFWGVVADVGLADPPRHVLEESGMEEALVGVDPAPTPVAADAPPASDRWVGDGDDDGDGSPLFGRLGDGPDANGDRPDFSLVTALGRSSLGSTFLADEPDARAWVPRLVARGRRFVPAIAGAPIVAVRACARPLSVDERPLLGAVPGKPGVFVAAGHGPWGISTGPASARLVGAAILGEPVAIPPELDAARFGMPGAG